MIDFACKRFDLNEIIKCGLGLRKSDFKIMQKMIPCKSFNDTKEISKLTGFDISTVQRSVKKLYEKEILLRKQINLNKGGYIFLYKVKSKTAIKNILIDIIDSWTNKTKTAIERW